MKNIKFLDNPQDYNPSNAFVVHVNSKDEILKQLNEKLLFPDYFGFNWNALWDMLCDFSWIEQQKVVLIHDELPNLDERELKIYLKILFDATKAWKKEDEHTLEVVFPESSEKQIKLVYKAVANKLLK